MKISGAKIEISIIKSKKEFLFFKLENKNAASLETAIFISLVPLLCFLLFQIPFP